MINFASDTQSIYFYANYSRSHLIRANQALADRAGRDQGSVRSDWTPIVPEEPLDRNTAYGWC